MSSSGKGSMFVPRSVAGRWVMLIVVAWLVWMMITHPADAIDLIGGILSAIGDLFSTGYEAYKNSGAN